jgi:hypothetical protein
MATARITELDSVSDVVCLHAVPIGDSTVILTGAVCAHHDEAAPLLTTTAAL